jgi:hypothetical protein
MWSKLCVAFLGLSAFSAASSNAASLFDFSGTNQTGTTLHFTSGAIGLDVTAVDSSGNTGGTVNQDSVVGLGVVGGDTNKTVDGPKEELHFAFAPSVTLDSVTYDNFTASANNGGDGTQIILTLLSNNTATPLFQAPIPVNGFVDLTGVADRTGATLVIRWDPMGRGNDNFSILNLSVETDQGNPPPAVPVPASAYAGMVLLGALAISRKVQKARAILA